MRTVFGDRDSQGRANLISMQQRHCDKDWVFLAMREKLSEFV